MVEKREDRPLLEVMMAGIRLPWYLATGVIAVCLLVLLGSCFLLEQPSINYVTWANLRGPLLPLAVILYVLTIYPPMRKLKAGAVSSLVPLVEAGSRGAVSDAFSSPRKRSELISVLAGLLVWAVLSQPWQWVRSPLAVYAAALDALMFGILGFVVLDGLDGTLRVSRMTRRHLRLDILDVSRLVPVANWSLAISMAFVGGISISIAFQDLGNLRHWQTLIFYAALISVALVVFFFSMWSTHGAIVRAKRAELSVVEENLSLAIRELRLTSRQGTAPENGSVYSGVTAWSAYERKLQEVPEWPYGAHAVRRLAASVLVPSAVYLLKLLLGWRL
jgi:hypothetical protein